MKSINGNVGIIYPLVPPHRLGVGLFVSRCGFKAPPESTDVVLLQLAGAVFLLSLILLVSSLCIFFSSLYFLTLRHSFFLLEESLLCHE